MHAFAFAYLINVRDVGMIERCGGPGLLPKAPHTLLIRGKTGRQDFDRDFAIQLRVFCQIDLTHATGAKLRADLVTAEYCACRKGRCHDSDAMVVNQTTSQRRSRISMPATMPSTAKP